jgi:hypothetical protein
MDESNDITDTVQSIIFIFDTENSFRVYIELAGLSSVKGTTTDEGLFLEVKENTCFCGSGLGKTEMYGNRWWQKYMLL